MREGGFVEFVVDLVHWLAHHAQSPSARSNPDFGRRSTSTNDSSTVSSTAEDAPMGVEDGDEVGVGSVSDTSAPWVGLTCEHGHEDCDGSPLVCLTRESEALGLYDLPFRVVQREPVECLCGWNPAEGIRLDVVCPVHDPPHHRGDQP